MGGRKESNELDHRPSGRPATCATIKLAGPSGRRKVGPEADSVPITNWVSNLSKLQRPVASFCFNVTCLCAPGALSGAPQIRHQSRPADLERIKLRLWPGSGARLFYGRTISRPRAMRPQIGIPICLHPWRPVGGRQTGGVKNKLAHRRHLLMLALCKADLGQVRRGRGRDQSGACGSPPAQNLASGREPAR